MSPRQTFYFDAAACSGCKACQVACKDRHGLEVGRLWRRVSEVTGGSWQQQGAAWKNDIFAYHLSLSCNHCEKPICLEGCPSRAITRRDDGVVLIDQDHCLGCGYCSWVCPYSAPQYHDVQGVMTKCNFCVEDLDAGLEPACVAACPVRALDFGDGPALARRYDLPDRSAELDPLPAAHLTEPSLLLVEHADGHRSSEKDVDLTPRPERGLREFSLVFFTLLSQMAAGLVLTGGGLRLWLGPEIQSVAAVLWPLAAGLMVLAMGVSTLHLGRPRNVLRSFLNLSTSWLSREIVLASAFLGMTVGAWWSSSSAGSSPLAVWLTMALALIFLLGMAGVYCQRTVPVWNRMRTPASFLGAALLLGGLGINALVWTLADFDSELVRRASVGLLTFSVVAVALPWRLWQMRGGKSAAENLAGIMTNALGLGLLLLLVTRPDEVPASFQGWMSWLLFLLALVDQMIKRRRYYGLYERVGV